MMTEPGGCAVDTPSEPSSQPSPRSSTFPKRPWNDVPEYVKPVRYSGSDARLGHVWVCWGALRTEYIKVEDLRANLQTNKD